MNPRRTPTAKATKCWANVYPDGAEDAFADFKLARFYCLVGDNGRTVPAWIITQEQVAGIKDRNLLAALRKLGISGGKRI